LGIQRKILYFLTLTLSILSNQSTLAGPTKTPTPISGQSLPKVTVIPNPAYGTKLTFRVMTAEPSLVRIRIFNRFFDRVDKLEQEGEHLFDILWSLKNVPEGIYYYQVQIVDKASGQFTKLPLQRFEVMKEENPSETGSK
jgi:hypothetical protein